MWTEAFLEYLTLERNYSLRTVEEYRDDLNAFESYYKKVDSTLSWETIDGDVVRDWMVSMMEAGRTATTVNRRIKCLAYVLSVFIETGLDKSRSCEKYTRPQEEETIAGVSKRK